MLWLLTALSAELSSGDDPRCHSGTPALLFTGLPVLLLNSAAHHNRAESDSLKTENP